MTGHRDPAAMTPEERLAEIARTFATGYRRRVLSREKELAGGPAVEAPCERPLNGNGAGAGTEVA